MCVVSMVMDHYYDRWNPPSPINDDEIKDFLKLLDRAKKYDKDNGEPDCELEEKKKKLRDLAKQLGVKIDLL